MFAVTKAIDEVKYRIPKEILDLAFLPRHRMWNSAPINIDDQIMSLVVRPRVLVDCNLVGGTEAFVNLDGLGGERPDDFTSVYRIPKSHTQGRSIISVLNVTFADPNRNVTFGVMSNINNTAMMRAGNSVMDAMGNIPITSTAKCQLIGENVVMIRDTTVLPANIFLRCILANDENMSHLQLKSYRAFSNLVTLAVKSYIYLTKTIEIDIGELHGGMNIGKIKEIIDSYADAEELYQQMLAEKWGKISLMNDSEQYTRYIRSLISVR